MTGFFHRFYWWIKNIASDSAVAWCDQSGFIHAETPFVREADITFAIGMQAR